MAFSLALSGCAWAGHQELRTIPLTITTADKQAHDFTVEVADTDDTQRHGLMGRTELAPDRGMLFIFKGRQIRRFWMKHTLIPLDMLFIGEGGQVLKIHENAQPHDLTTVSSEFPVRWVLEIAGGGAKTLGITAGSVVTSPSLRFDELN